jgi:hypothetical protein
LRFDCSPWLQRFLIRGMGVTKNGVFPAKGGYEFSAPVSARVEYGHHAGRHLRVERHHATSPLAVGIDKQRRPETDRYKWSLRKFKQPHDFSFDILPSP